MSLFSSSISINFQLYTNDFMTPEPTFQLLSVRDCQRATQKAPKESYPTQILKMLPNFYKFRKIYIIRPR